MIVQCVSCSFVKGSHYIILFNSYIIFFSQMALPRVLLVVPLFATSILGLYFLVQNAPPTDNQVRWPLLTHNFSIRNNIPYTMLIAHNDIGTYQLYDAKWIKAGILAYFPYPYACGWLNWPSFVIVSYRK